MEFNRNQYFLVGMIILLLGIQFRVVKTFVLTEKVTLFLAEKTGKITPETAQAVEATRTTPSLFPGVRRPAESMTQKSIEPPPWIGWALISVGAVLILHSLAMTRPSG